MRLLELSPTPVFEVYHRCAAPGGGSRDATLQVLRGIVDSLPAPLRAVFVTSDLQGRCWQAPHSGSLLGQVLAEELALHCWGAGIDPGAVGVMLGGDLFTPLDVSMRGGRGDVRAVWTAFAEHAAFVTGVAGNHDDFGVDQAELAAFTRIPRIHLLDIDGAGASSCKEIGGLRIAGVSGIVGNPDKPWRRTEQNYLAAVSAALATRPDVLVLHQNPALPDVRRADLHGLTSLLAADADCLVTFGHSFCDRPMLELGSAQLLATEERAFWLERPQSTT